MGAHFLVSEYRPGVVVWDHVPEQLAVAGGIKHGDPGRRIGFAVVDALADLHLVDPGLPAVSASWADPRATSRGSSTAGASAGRRSRRRVIIRSSGWPSCWPATSRPPAARPWCTTTSRSTTASSRRATPTWSRRSSTGTWRPWATRWRTWAPCSTTGPTARPRPTAYPAWRASACLPAPRRSRGTPSAPARDLSHADVAWYEAFGCWKTAVIMQQLYARHQRGESTDDRMAARGEQVGRIAERALALAETFENRGDR